MLLILCHGESTNPGERGKKKNFISTQFYYYLSCCFGESPHLKIIDSLQIIIWQSMSLQLILTQSPRNSTLSTKRSKLSIEISDHQIKSYHKTPQPCSSLPSCTRLTRRASEASSCACPTSPPTNKPKKLKKTSLRVLPWASNIHTGRYQESLINNKRTYPFASENYAEVLPRKLLLLHTPNDK